jgi:hypothetical protein
MRRCPKAWAGGFDHISVYSSSALPGSGHNNSGTGTQCSGRNASSSSLPSSSPSARRNNISSSVTPIVVMDEASRCLARRQPIAQRSLPTSGTTTRGKGICTRASLLTINVVLDVPLEERLGLALNCLVVQKSLLRNPTEASATPAPVPQTGHRDPQLLLQSNIGHWLQIPSRTCQPFQRCAPSADGVLDMVLPADVRETIMIDNEALATNLTALHLHTSQVFLTPRDLLCHGCSIQHLRRSWWSLVVLCSVVTSTLRFGLLGLWTLRCVPIRQRVVEQTLLLQRQLSSRCYTIMCFVNNNFASNIVFKWVKLRFS